MAQSFAHVLINSLLPKSLRFGAKEVITKSSLNRKLVSFAKQEPELFNENITSIKQYGDMFATYEGISVGIDDIEPDYAARDKILNEAENKLKKTSNVEERNKIYLDAQSRVRKLAAQHKGDLGLMARSGGRGNVNQLMKTVASPVVVGDHDGNPVDFLIKNSYSEGLSPLEYWIAANESRGQVIKGQLGTAEPGDMSKVLANTSNRQVVSEEDCGTKNGMPISSRDKQALGRYLSRDQVAGKRNDVVDQRMLDRMQGKTLFIRGPMTCEATAGVCTFCQGVMNNGMRMNIGENAGLRSAQALSEPLTQMALSSKHGIALVEGASNMPRGLKGLRQFLEAPKNFIGKAELSKISGTITKIEKAPHGGHYVHVNNTQHYVSPKRRVKVSLNQRVQAGDILSDGIPNPNEIVDMKGIGEGRRYLVDKVHEVYKDSGLDIDKRNIEHIVKPHLNFAKIEKAPGMTPGEIVDVSKVSSLLKGKGVKVPLSEARGKTLARNYLQHIAGTKISSYILSDLQRHNIDQVEIFPGEFDMTPVTTSITRSPLLNDNWLNKLGHRYLSSTIQSAAHGAEEASTTGYAPIAAYVRGKSFGKGPKGNY